MHLGGLRTALFNYLFARRHGGKFLLRVEDTDRTRFVPGAVENILGALEWAGFSPDEGAGVGGPHAPYYQSERTSTYRHHVEKLLEDGNAYRCFCTPERLQSVREQMLRAGKRVMYDGHCASLTIDEARQLEQAGKPHTIRLRVPHDGVTTVHDMVRGFVHFANEIIDHQVLLKSDGLPTYHLASVVDDHLMRISHVIRGEEWLPSTPKHLLLYSFFGWEAPHFAHLPLLTNPGGSKLSKRQGDISVDFYKAEGYLPEAVVNFVSLLGWTPPQSSAFGGHSDVLFLRELEKVFTIDHVHKASAVVSREKLDSLGSMHIRRMVEERGEELVDQVTELLKGYDDYDKDLVLDRQYTLRVCDTVKERVRTLSELAAFVRPFYARPDLSSADAVALAERVWSPESSAAVEELLGRLEGADAWDSDALAAALRDTAASTSVRFKTLSLSVRLLCTGSSVGASLAHSLAVLGRGETLHRLSAGARELAARRGS